MVLQIYWTGKETVGVESRKTDGPGMVVLFISVTKNYLKSEFFQMPLILGAWQCTNISTVEVTHQILGLLCQCLVNVASSTWIWTSVICGIFDLRWYIRKWSVVGRGSYWIKTQWTICFVPQHSSILNNFLVGFFSESNAQHPFILNSFPGVFSFPDTQHFRHEDIVDFDFNLILILLCSLWNLYPKSCNSRWVWFTKWSLR